MRGSGVVDTACQGGPAFFPGFNFPGGRAKGQEQSDHERQILQGRDPARGRCLWGPREVLPP